MVIARRSLFFAALIVAALVAFLSIFAASAFANTGANETPRLDVLRVTNGEVLDSVVIGNRVILVGTFTQVQNAGGNTISQPYIAAYNADTGAYDPSFAPDVDDFVNAIATDGNAVYITGQFSNVEGEAHRRIAKLNSNGSVNSRFIASMGSTPVTLDVAHGKVYVGGNFTLVNNVSRTSFAAVSSTTGALDNETNFSFTGSAAPTGGMGVRWIEVSPNGNFLFLSHTAREIDGQDRTGIAKFDISANSTSLSTWRTTHFADGIPTAGSGQRMRRLAISPDGSYVVIVTSGDDRPPTNDVVVRFSTSGNRVSADWVSRHFDTVLGVAINDQAVFVGGHFQFQEAPGSTNPFPGDPEIQFGFGQDQGPSVLGEEVVRREQLGALNPNTGKSLDWNPGSDSFIGVQSLTWSDRYGLLVGHDANRLGGVQIGRHAVFGPGNTPGAPTPTPTPTPGGPLTCEASFNGSTATVTFSGDLGNSLQALRNGSWAATVTGNSATINANTGDTIGARVRGPNYDGAQDITCSVNNNAPAPAPGGVIDTQITSPVSGGVVTGGTVSITGESEAPAGVSRTRLTIQRADTGEYLTPNGSFVPEWTPLDTDFNGNAQLESWSYDVNLPFVGQYDIAVRTFDVNNERDATVRRSFVVGLVNNEPPSVLPNLPVVDGNTVTLTGTAIDDLGISEVSLLLLNRDTNQYYRLDGTVGEAQRIQTTVVNPGDTRPTWSITLENVPDGSWNAIVDARDTSNQRDRSSNSFTVG